MAGILYGVGVGPGDPELLTLKALKTIDSADYIAIPNKNKDESRAWRTASLVVPELEKKHTILLDLPMTQDSSLLAESHRRAAKKLEQVLDTGSNIAFLTIGDVTLYSTFGYMKDLVEMDGYHVILISGVPSFCAAAAVLGISLSDRDDSIQVITPKMLKGSPPVEQNDDSYIVLKAGNELNTIKERFPKESFSLSLVENAGNPEEKLYQNPDDFPEKAGYFSLVIVKRKPH